MPRLRQVTKAEADEKTRALYERAFPGRDPVAQPGTATGSPGNFITVIAQVPWVRDHFLHLSPLVTPGENNPSNLDMKLRILAILRAAYNQGSCFIYSQQCKAARINGVRETQIDAVKHWQVSSEFDAKERAVLAWSDALVLSGGRASDELFDELHRHLSDGEILELTWLTNCYAMFSATCVALRLEYDDVSDRIREIPIPEGGGVAQWRRTSE